MDWGLVVAAIGLVVGIVVPLAIYLRSRRDVQRVEVTPRPLRIVLFAALGPAVRRAGWPGESDTTSAWSRECKS